MCPHRRDTMNPDRRHSGQRTESRQGSGPVGVDSSALQFSIYVLPPSMSTGSESWSAVGPVARTVAGTSEPERAAVEPAAVQQSSRHPRSAGFWTGFWHRFFGGKVTVSVQQPDGTTVERRVSAQLSERMKTAARVEPPGTDVVTVHVIGLHGGIRQEAVKVGKDVGRRTVRKFQDKQTHCLYAMDLLEKGVRTRLFMPKDTWDLTCEDMRAKGLLDLSGDGGL